MTVAAILEDDDQAPSLAGQVGRGLRWSFADTLLRRVGTTALGIVMARILLPRDYGVYAVALVAFTAILSMNELGVSPAVVRWPTRDVRRVLPTAVSMAVFTSAALMALCMLGAPALASLLHAPDATGVVRLLALGILIDGLSSVPGAVLTREFRQDLRMIADSTAFVVTAATMLGLAIAGAGPWSLVGGQLAGNVVSAALFIRFAPGVLRFGYDRDAAAELARVGLPLAGASALVFAIGNVDYLVVGAVLGPVQLGLYLLAWNLASWPVNVFSTAARKVSLAGFARVADDEARVREGFLDAATALCAVMVPACVLLAVLAPEVVSVVYGDPWAAAAKALGLLALVGVIRALGELVYDLLVARGRSRTAVLLQVAWLVSLVVALELGARIAGIAGAGAAHLLAGALVTLPLLVLIVRKDGVEPSALLGRLARPLVAGAAAAGVATMTARVTDHSLGSLVVAGTAGALTYAALVLPLLRRAWALRTISSPLPDRSST